MGKEDTNTKFITAFYLTLNIFFSIAIVLLNKWLYVYSGFPSITLSVIHFVFTFIGLIICEKFNVFCIKDIAIKNIFLITLVFCGFVVLTNLSLAYNTIGTYQVAKMLITPCVIMMQTIFYKKYFSIYLKLTLIPIILGIVINFYYDTQFKTIGLVHAIMGVLLTALYQVMINRRQSEFRMDPMQLLYYQTPLSAIMLFLIVPFLEPIEQIFKSSWSLIDIIIVVLSGIVAFFVNLTSYWIMGLTTPLIGSLIFHETLSMNQVIGIILTMVGVTLYVYIKAMHTQVVVPNCRPKEKTQEKTKSILLHKI